jgi:hypothetical protein
MMPLQWKEISAVRCALVIAICAALGACSAGADSSPTNAAEPAIGSVASPIMISGGFTLASDTNPNMVATAWPSEGQAVVLRTSCVVTGSCFFNTERWLYKDGMLSPAGNPSLSIFPLSGGDLVLTGWCLSSNPNCRWVYAKGRFYNENQPNLAINTSGAEGSNIRVADPCYEFDAHCTWTMRNLMMNVASDTLSLRGAGAGNYVTSIAGCTADNDACFWRISHGMIQRNSLPGLMFSTLGGAYWGNQIRLENCPGNPNCTWTFRQGMIWSDADPSLALNVANGAFAGNLLQLYGACSAADSACMFNER